MKLDLSFNGRIGRGTYALAAGAIVIAQTAVMAGVFEHQLQAIDAFFTPATRAHDATWSAVTLLGAVGFHLAMSWVQAMLAFRRAADGGLWRGWAALAIVPWIQVPVVAVFALLPTRETDPAEPTADGADWSAATVGVIFGALLCVTVVAVGALALGTYGWGLFVLSPLLVGFTSAHIANRGPLASPSRARWAAASAIWIGGLLLIAFVLEGVICIIMASPLAVFMGWIGAELANGLERLEPGKRPQGLVSVAVLPLVFALEVALPPLATIETRQSIEIAAPPAAVWRTLVGGDPIEGRLALPFRLGVAYPVSATLEGEGVGAIRRGVFSTGEALERVTEWAPERVLAFTVVSDPPSMRELSPYREVHAPHLTGGYFHTTRTRFELVPLAGGGTRVVEETAHELRLDPVLYWLPMARWVVDANNARVLESIRVVSERG